MDTRDVVLDILLDMESHNTFSSIAIAKALRKNQFTEKQERAFVSRLAEGTTEYRITLDYIINQFSKTPVSKCKPLIRCVLRMGAYQIMYMDSVPDSAACNESVKLVRKHNFGTLSGFVNGVLRTISRQKDNIKYPSPENKKSYLSVKYSMPEWLVDKIIRDYGENANSIIESTLADRPTTIRVNNTLTTREELKCMLEKENINVEYGAYHDRSLVIDGYDFIRKVSGYRQGYFTVQDESSMCAIRAAGIKKKDIVLDVCAAPGGKSTLCAEYLEGQGTVYSMDISEEKLSLIAENAERLRLDNIKISAHDALEPLDIKKLCGREHVDVVIADLPCSGLGIMGRKNDIKYRLSGEEQLDELVNLQRSILNTVKDYVRNGGTLLYSTCTINPDENEKNVQWFLMENENFELVEERLFLPGREKCDGFFYAVLRKK